jgi:hypothetical protein
VKETTSFGVLLLTKGSLLLVISIRSLHAKRKILSFEEVFGGPKFS